MLKLGEETKVYLSLTRIDMRCGIFSLSSRVEEVFGKDSKDGNLYVFVSRDKKKVKIINWEEDGYWLHYKRLAVGTFQMKLTNGVEEITGVDLSKLLSGISLSKIKLSKKVKSKLVKSN